MTAQPRRLPSSCERHPGHPFTGFCAPCLSERLSGLDANASPKLRRSKSFSAVRARAPPLEPQRRSCDVRGRNTLWSLFHLDDTHRHHPAPAACIAAPVLEVLEDDDEIRPADPAPELRTMKEHIDLQPHLKKPESTGSFWLAASVFSKKLQKWRRRQKMKKSGDNAGSASGQKAQSEIVVDGYGRRSCDIDRRFSFSIEAGRMSLDARRMSVDEPRFSWDAPRASWDGHLIGGRARFPPMLAVGEGGDGRDPATERWDGKIPVEEESTIPGGTAHTRDYYLDSSSGRRRSLDRSDSVRRQSVEVSEMKLPHIVNQSPSSELFNLHNVIKRDRDDRSESFESAFRDSQKGAAKNKSRKWGKAWNIWGFIYRRGGSRRGADGNEVERTFSESWPDMRGTGKISRSNSNVSMRSSSFHNNAGYGSMRKSSLETSGHGKKRRGEFVLERNRSARYSPSHVDNGMLRFYLTPMRGSRRNGFSGKNRHSTSSYSITKTMLGMY